MESRKSPQEQVREIGKLIEDAQERLDQARYALDTLVARLDQDASAGDG
jgi:hypothetical protein